MKQYTLPDFLNNGWETLSFGTALSKMKKHGELLNKQVLFSELFNNFYLIPELESFQLHVKAVDQRVIPNENEFAPIVLEPIYEFNISHVKLKNGESTDSIDLLLGSSLKAFDNYLNGNEQEAVLLWMWKRGKDTEVLSHRKGGANTNYIFEITQELATQLCKDAYQENYPQFYKEVVEKTVAPAKNVVQMRNKL